MDRSDAKTGEGGANTTTRIEQAIVRVRGLNVMLDADLAALYGVTTRALNQAVQRNRDRFPPDFMFQLIASEAGSLRSQFVILNSGRGAHRKYVPYAFTEQGVAKYDGQFRAVFQAIRALMNPPPQPQPSIGFRPK